MDQQILVQHFNNLLSSNLTIIEQSQQFLEREFLKFGFFKRCMDVVKMESVNSDIALLKVILVFLGKELKINWKLSPPDSPEMPAEEKNYFLENVFQFVLSLPDVVKLKSLLKKMFLQSRIDWEESVQQNTKLLHIIQESLVSGDSKAKYVGLLFIEMMVKSVQYQLENDFTDNLMRTFLGHIQSIVVGITEIEDESIINSLLLIAKMFRSATIIKLPKCFLQNQTMSIWIHIFLRMIQSLLFHNNQPLTPNTIKLANVISNCFCRIIQKYKNNPKSIIFLRHANPQIPSQQLEKECAKQIQHNFFTNFFNLCIEILKAQFDKLEFEYLQAQTIRMLVGLMKSKYMEVANNFLQLFFDYILPLVQLSPKDTKLYDTDPKGYLLASENLIDYINNVREMSMELIEAVFGACPTLIEPFLLKAVSILEKSLTSSETNPRMAEAILLIIEKVEPRGNNKELMDQHRLRIAEKYIWTIIESDIAIIRFRGCSFLRNVSLRQSENPQLMECLFKRMIVLLDDDIAVKTKAAIAISNLIHYDSLAQSIAKQNCQILIEKIMLIQQEIEIEDLTYSFSQLIGFFKNEIEPFAASIVDSLLLKYHSYFTFDHNDEDETQDGEQTLFLQGILENIKTIMDSIQNPQMKRELIQKTLPFISEALIHNTQDAYDFFEASFDIFNSANQVETSMDILWTNYFQILSSCLQNPNLSTLAAEMIEIVQVWLRTLMLRFQPEFLLITNGKRERLELMSKFLTILFKVGSDIEYNLKLFQTFVEVQLSLNPFPNFCAKIVESILIDSQFKDFGSSHTFIAILSLVYYAQTTQMNHLFNHHKQHQKMFTDALLNLHFQDSKISKIKNNSLIALALAILSLLNFENTLSQQLTIENKGSLLSKLIQILIKQQNTENQQNNQDDEQSQQEDDEEEEEMSDNQQVDNEELIEQESKSPIYHIDLRSKFVDQIKNLAALNTEEWNSLVEILDEDEKYYLNECNIED